MCFSPLVNPKKISYGEVFRKEGKIRDKDGV
jgi:hypothetical protein